MEKERFHIGMRIIKTSVAVLLSLVVQMLFKRDSSFYAAIAAVVCLQNNFNTTLKSGINRFTGTIIGAVIGFLLLKIQPTINYYQEFLYIIIVPIALMLTMYICKIIKKTASIGICCIVFLSIAVNFERDLLSTELYVIYRILDTTVGIIIAYLVDRFLVLKKDR